MRMPEIVTPVEAVTHRHFGCKALYAKASMEFDEPAPSLMSWRLRHTPHFISKES